MPPTHLADTSAWAQLHRSEVAARLVSLLVGGGAATCGIVDLEVLGAIQDPQELALAVEERRMFPQAPIDDGVLARAIEVRHLLAGRPIPVTALVVAAAAERAGLILLHDHDAFDDIAAVTGQPVERVAP
jgi:predicted nucleic acid-binding protein